MGRAETGSSQNCVELKLGRHFSSKYNIFDNITEGKMKASIKPKKVGT